MQRDAWRDLDQLGWLSEGAVAQVPGASISFSSALHRWRVGSTTGGCRSESIRSCHVGRCGATSGGCLREREFRCRICNLRRRSSTHSPAARASTSKRHKSQTGDSGLYFYAGTRTTKPKLLSVSKYSFHMRLLFTALKRGSLQSTSWCYIIGSTSLCSAK